MLAWCAVSVLLGCEPVEPAPPVPARDTSYDADLDAARIILPARDAPPIDSPRPDVPGLDGGDPDLDGGTRLPLVIDGQLDEPEWLEGVAASQDRTGVGAFLGCRLDRLYFLADDVNIYVAIEATLCAGSLLLFVDTGSAGVDLAPGGLGDVSGEIDAALSRPQVLVDLDFRPSFGWGTTMMPSIASSADDVIGWRELRQDSAHRHLSADFTECSDIACETRVSRAALGFPSVVRLAARIATESDGSSLGLPPDGDPSTSITAYVVRSVSP